MMYSTKGPEEFESPLLKHAESYSFLFTEEGEYKHLCRPHPYMKGIIVVEEE